ncbi:hypothetical protein [Photobacterium phosphoreum]|uniref:hypothetical protein n=1 Tax=Photobacterium phosphoreum TaxID=659 RepID=UPI000D186435|nr:hypothetical protein [Photobacterium phosphoreum]MCD9481734.1 hypothetical protein [Photobacterium phosphoreum]PSU37306.1 hypothetical protein CTM85_13345 [Photobacterium phosphoreum]
MGTSMSSKGPNGTNPLVPPWAQDGDSVVISDENGNESEMSNDEVQDKVEGPIPTEVNPTRFTAARRAFGEYAKSGRTQDLKKSLQKYSSNSTGKGRGFSKRMASGVTAGTGLYGLLTGGTVTTTNGTLNLSNLSGLSVDQAIDQISELLTPLSADADNVRSAINFALSEAIEDCEEFDDVTFTPELTGQIFTYYLTDLIFQQVVIDMGKAWFKAETPIRQIKMETELRELIKMIVDVKLDKETNGDFSNISNNQISQIQIAAIQETINEWENF